METFDEKSAHHFFSISCFNEAWELMEKPQRTADEDEQMLRLSMASHYHWTQREDYAASNRSVGFWQISRIYTLLGQTDNARRYAQLCLAASQEADVEPFFLAYAYEALARVEGLSGNREKMQTYLKEAFRLAENVTDQEDRQVLLNDLQMIHLND